MILSPKIKVAVLRGGQSSGYEDSLRTGNHILSTLREMSDTFEPLDIFISKVGEWHRGGLVYEPHEALAYTDIAWNALHGRFGEDGQVTRILESLKIPFTGSGALSSAMTTSRDLARNLYREHSLLTPRYEIITEDNLDEDRLITIFRNYSHPVSIRPARSSEISANFLAYTFKELREKVHKALEQSPKILVEEFIVGDEVFCLAIDQARGEKIYSPIPVSDGKIKLRLDESRKVEDMAKLAHQIFGLRHYSSSNFLVTPKRNIYILGTNTSPELYEDSSAYKSLVSTGWRSRDFVDHILQMAL